ncbi:MAG: hypothetical protein JOY86_02050 [Candidatus Eremiobacteraeota bacterium]|nr:hypothetical protein [Candidatus Eremiobacteraeota bacterium]MBV8365717.1 hypothetical protein [Candidatus Eremiobacteraeota bacterium]
MTSTRIAMAYAVAVFGAAGIGASAPQAAPASAPSTPEQWIAAFQTAWDALKSYQATITAREFLNGKIQDRVYAIKFQKPTSARLDITGGDGKGSAAVWQGGDRVQGHQGGWLSPIHLNVNIHAKIATSMRGRTIADAPFGAALEHIKSVKWKSTQVSVSGDRSTWTGEAEDPTQNNGVTKEVMTLGANGLPVEVTEFEGDQTVRHETYSDIQLNVEFPPSTWQI